MDWSLWYFPINHLSWILQFTLMLRTTLVQSLAFNVRKKDRMQILSTLLSSPSSLNIQDNIKIRYSISEELYWFLKNQRIFKLRGVRVEKVMKSKIHRILPLCKTSNANPYDVCCRRTRHVKHATNGRQRINCTRSLIAVNIIDKPGPTAHGCWNL